MRQSEEKTLLKQSALPSCGEEGISAHSGDFSILGGGQTTFNDTRREQRPVARERGEPSQGPPGPITAMVVGFGARASLVLWHLCFSHLPAGSTQGAPTRVGTRTQTEVNGEKGNCEIRGEYHRLSRVLRRSSEERPGGTKLHHYSHGSLSAERPRGPEAAR